MVHHIGIGVVGAALLAAILAPSACNPLKSKEDTPPPAAQVQADAATSQSVEDAARLYLTDLYLTDQSSGLFSNAFLLEPRTFGVTLGKRF